MEGDRRAEAGSSSASRTLRDVLGSPTESGDDALVHERNAELDEEEVEGEEDEEVGADGFVPGPLIPLKEQLEKDKVLILVSSFFLLFLAFFLLFQDSGCGFLPKMLSFS